MPKNYHVLLLFILFISAAIILGVFLPEIIALPWIGEGENLSAALRNYTFVVAAIIGFGLAIWRAVIADKTNLITARGHITDRYSKAVEQLGADKSITVRLGGLYALKRIANESPNDLSTI